MNMNGTQAVICEFSASEEPILAHIVSASVGKLVINGGKLNEIQNELRNFSKSMFKCYPLCLARHSVWLFKSKLNWRWNFSALTQVVIRNVGLQNISDDAIASDSKLQLLDLSNNQLSSVEFLRGAAEHLQLLDLSHNQLNHIDPDVMMSFVWLKCKHDELFAREFIFNSSGSHSTVTVKYSHSWRTLLPHAIIRYLNPWRHNPTYLVSIIRFTVYSSSLITAVGLVQCFHVNNIFVHSSRLVS